MKGMVKLNNLNVLRIIFIFIILCSYATTSRCQSEQRESFLFDAIQIERIDSVHSLDKSFEHDIYTIYAISTHGTHYKILSHFDLNTDISDKAKLEIGKWYIMPLKSILQGPVSKIGGQYLKAHGAAITGTNYYGQTVSVEPSSGIFDLHTAQGLNGRYFSQRNIKVYAFNDNIGKVNAATKEFHEKALYGQVAQSLMEEGVECWDVEYKYSEDYLKHNPNGFALRIINYGQPRPTEHSTIKGRLYLIPDEIAAVKAEKLNAVIKAYINDNPEYQCTFCETGHDNSLTRVLYSDQYEKDNDSFHILTGSLENGWLAVLLLFAEGEMVIPIEYWKVTSVKDENRQENPNNNFALDTKEFYESDEIFEDVKEMPEFYGGEKGLSNYFWHNIQDPISAMTNNIQARIIVSFVIERDGTVSNVETLEFENVYEEGGSKEQTKMLQNLTEKDFADINTELKREAERVVKMMPRWIPGKKDGKIARVRMTVPINFLNSY